MDSPRPDVTPACLYCNDTGIQSVITTPKGEFRAYCDKCSLGIGITQPAPPPVTPPTNDLFIE